MDNHSAYHRVEERIKQENSHNVFRTRIWPIQNAQLMLTTIIATYQKPQVNPPSGIDIWTVIDVMQTST